VAKLGFIGTAWMSLTPVAILLISKRSPPMFLAISARSGIVVTTRIFASTPAWDTRSVSTTESNTHAKRFIVDSLAVPEAVRMAPKDRRPLQEDLVRVGWPLWDAWLAKIGVLHPQALELRGPEREVR